MLYLWFSVFIEESRIEPASDKLNYLAKVGCGVDDGKTVAISALRAEAPGDDNVVVNIDARDSHYGRDDSDDFLVGVDLVCCH